MIKWIIYIIIAFILCIRIDINIDGTIWKEKGTDRPILILKYDREGVTYKYMEDPFERHMSLRDLVRGYDYEGE